jgi:hypothetical protein
MERFPRFARSMPLLRMAGERSRREPSTFIGVSQTCF